MIAVVVSWGPVGRPRTALVFEIAATVQMLIETKSELPIAMTSSLSDQSRIAVAPLLWQFRHRKRRRLHIDAMTRPLG